MGNFDYMRDLKNFTEIADAAIIAEQSYSIPTGCVVLSRRAMEFGIKWVFNADSTLPEPGRDLSANINNSKFIEYVGRDLIKEMKALKRFGDDHHNMGIKATSDDAMAALRFLFDFLRWINFAYIDNYPDVEFSEDAVKSSTFMGPGYGTPEFEKQIQEKDAELSKTMGKIKELEDLYSAERQRNLMNRRYDPRSMNEYSTRKRLIDVDIAAAGWDFSKTAHQIWEEMPLDKITPEDSELYADYVLLGKDGLPLAVVEAKRAWRDANDGRNQVFIYADRLEHMYGRRPLMFWTNGYDTFFWDDSEGPYREVSGIFSRDDLERIISRRMLKKPLGSIEIDKNITNRPYQESAIRAVCEDISKGLRKHLVVMATGTGKTRTAVSLYDVLSRANMVTNCLFLVDRTELAKQADEDGFRKNLPNVSTCNLCLNKKDLMARVVVSTYQTMINAIDEIKNESSARVFTPAHFDLIFVDECHRSIFNTYGSILEYFDAKVIGLTATPKDEVSRNTYRFFGKDSGDPTYVYEYGRAVEEKWLVPYQNFEVRTQFLMHGIHYDDLSEEDKQMMEEDFEGIHDVDREELNKFVFNKSTIDTVLQDLMRDGIKVDGGEVVGKTIIFAENKLHSEVILKRFNELYPEYKGLLMARVVCDDSGSSKIIDNFKKMKDKQPQIVVSVDMMDTGVDVSDCVNLVFFKRVRSKIKFLQMIGRGTRLDKETAFVDSIDGEYIGKRRFFIFDYLDNFEFFRTEKKTFESDLRMSLSQMIFEKKVRIIHVLQKEIYSDEEHQTIRKAFVADCLNAVSGLNENLFYVQKQLRYVHVFKDPESFNSLSDDDVTTLVDKIAPIVESDESDPVAKRFDNFMLGLMILSFEGTSGIAKSQKKLNSMMDSLLDKLTIPQVKAKESKIREVRGDDFWADLNCMSIEDARQELRGLIQFLEDSKHREAIITNLSDPVLERVDGMPLPELMNYENYRRRVEKYLRGHTQDVAICKLMHNEPLDSNDVVDLRKIFVEELGTWDNYKTEYQEKGFGRLVREILKMDRDSVAEAFSEFINKGNLNSSQIDFVNRIINHIAANGFMDVGELADPHFDTNGDITQLFSTEQSLDIVGIINGINHNAEV